MPTTLPDTSDSSSATRVFDKLHGVDLEPYMLKTIQVSTAMIPQKTADQLTEHLLKFFYLDLGDSGWVFIAVPEDEMLIACPMLVDHPELLKLIDWAAARGFDRVEMDCDAQPLPVECGLPIFQW